MTRTTPLLETSLVIVLMALAVVGLPAAQRAIVIGPPEVVTFGPLINAPNGHISFRQGPAGYHPWVPGRLPTGQDTHQEGGFLFDVANWTLHELSQATAAFVLGHTQTAIPDCSVAFDANYAALNAVVPGADPATLLGFYDAEYHVACPEGAGQPLLSSIGLATSTDGGVTWQRRGQVIQGLDEARKGFAFITARQLDEFSATPSRILDAGASGPSAVVRKDEDAAYLYLYYADRTPITGGDDSIYVARALLAGDGMPGTWQQWTGAGWGVPGDLTLAAPIIVPAPGDVALQPHVSWNTVLGSWLMVFRTSADFEITTSGDGVRWSSPAPLLAFDPNDEKTGFPTLVSPHATESADLGVSDESDANACWRLLPPGLNATQQVTGAVGWLFYSSLPKHTDHYVGHRAAFRIVDQ